MGALLVYLAICLLPGLALLALDRCYRAWTGEAPWRSRTRRHARPTRPAPLPLERLVADLHRLEQEIAALEHSTQPARVHRLEAVMLAYDDTLRACCAQLDLPAPPHRRRQMQGLERLQVEADLSQAGLRW